MKTEMYKGFMICTHEKEFWILNSNGEILRICKTKKKQRRELIIRHYNNFSSLSRNRFTIFHSRLITNKWR